MYAKVPGAVNTRDDGVDSILEPFGDPVHGKGDKNRQANDSSFATPTAVRTAFRVISRRFVGDINSRQSDREPGSKGSSEKPANQGNQIDMTKLLAYTDASLEHQG